jgi:hypothetical protein
MLVIFPVKKVHKIPFSDFRIVRFRIMEAHWRSFTNFSCELIKNEVNYYV